MLWCVEEFRGAWLGCEPHVVVVCREAIASLKFINHQKFSAIEHGIDIRPPFCRRIFLGSMPAAFSGWSACKLGYVHWLRIDDMEEASNGDISSNGLQIRACADKSINAI